MRSDSISTTASKIRSRFNKLDGVSIETIDEMSSEIFVAYHVHGGPQSSFIVKHEYPSQFDDGGMKATSVTLMLPTLPDDADETAVDAAIKEFDDEIRKQTGVPPASSMDIAIQSVGDGRAPRIGRKNVALEKYLDYIEQVVSRFEEQDLYDV